MKKIAISGFLLFVIAFVALFAGGLWYSSNLDAPSTDRTTKRFVVNRGAGVSDTAQRLESEGLIKSALAFRIYTQLNDLTGKIPAGEFDLPQNVGVAELITTMTQGPTQLWVSIPEGFRREQTAEKVASDLNLSGDAATNFKAEFLSLTRDKEGYLYPDTYLFPKEVTAQGVVNRLTAEFTKKTEGLTVDRSDVNLAAILERETKNVKTEGPIVAGILLKRVEAGWPIQADATVQYALGKSGEWWPTPTRDDLQVNHPYNTYKIQGLPPAPIASPGIEAIKAALSAEESDYWYYIHGTDGKIYFATTLEEHNENVRKYIQ
jgi:UPF0755 protein